MLILFYNLYFNKKYWFYQQFGIENLSDFLPSDIDITFDKKYINEADVVLFNVPHLPNKLNGNLSKQKHQIWVSWNMESEINYPWINYPDLKCLFDVTMGYRSTNDVFIPYFSPYFYNDLKNPPNKKDKDICMFISSSMNKSKRVEYAKELMEYIPIDSYGKILNNCKLDTDKGFTTKVEVVGSYKFNIAFENAVDEDYVTEKFYEPLVGGSVPIYLGAANIKDFAPGDNSFINVNDFKSPKELAYTLKDYIENEKEYDKFFDWKKESFSPSFEQLITIQKKNPFLRLIDKVKELKLQEIPVTYLEEPIKIPFVSGVLSSNYIREK